MFTEVLKYYFSPPPPIKSAIITLAAPLPLDENPHWGMCIKLQCVFGDNGVGREIWTSGGRGCLLQPCSSSWAIRAFDVLIPNPGVTDHLHCHAKQTMLPTSLTCRSNFAGNIFEMVVATALAEHVGIVFHILLTPSTFIFHFPG